MKEFFQKLVEFFAPTNQYQSEVDTYISSKNPSNAADVEYWLRQYESRSKSLTQVYSR